MKIDCVVVARTFRELNFLFRCHAKLFNLRSSTKYKLVLADGMEVHYMIWDRFETWKLGRTYIHLMDYIMANDCFHHSGHPISKTELRDLILKEGESEYVYEAQNPCDTCKNVGDCEPCEKMREGDGK